MDDDQQHDEDAKPGLNELLDAMDVNNLPELIDWGPPVGKEVW